MTTIRRSILWQTIDSRTTGQVQTTAGELALLIILDSLPDACAWQVTAALPPLTTARGTAATRREAMEAALAEARDLADSITCHKRPARAAYSG